MSRSREERHKEYNVLLGMKAEVEEVLLKIPGVIRIAVGAKLTNNNVEYDDMCFRVYVNEKKNIGDIKENEIIPAMIKGIKTDVNEVNRNVSFSDEDMGHYRPLSGGARIYSAKGNSMNGTLGCFATDDENENNVVLLTCYHILMLGGEEKGHQVGQPDFCCDDCCCRCGEIATLERGAWDEHNVDCAIAKLSNGNENNWTNEVIEIGPISGIPVNENKEPIDPFTQKTTHSDGSKYQPLLPHETVFKRGMNTRRKEGVVIEIDHDITFDYELKDGTKIPKTFTKQILIHPKAINEPFTGKGDSGSVIVNHLNQVVGIFFADNEQRDDQGKVTANATLALANPIQDVLKELKISIPDTGTFLSLPLKSASIENRLASKTNVLDELVTTIERQQGGTILIDTFRKHRREVMNLINTDREVKVAWNRYHGPVFTAHLMEKMKDHAYKMPVELEGVSWQRLLSKMSVVLEKKGSTEMSTDIEKHSTNALLLIAKLVHGYA
jgi:hypothetical protein